MLAPASLVRQPERLLPVDFGTRTGGATLSGAPAPSDAVAIRRHVLLEMARHEVCRRLDAGYLARLVCEHLLDEDEATETIVDLVAGRPHEVFEL